MSHTPPQTLGKYHVIREIARSNDIVYEAFDPEMNRRVALKELAFPRGATEAQREERLKRFMREAKAAGSLAHPNIVTVYDVDQDGDRTFLAMEFLTGHNLRNSLDTKGQIQPERAVEIAIEVLKGLEFAHTHGVVHRDIKPDNVQILDGGQIKITDFGIARLMFEPNLTVDGQVFGTPSYMSPEQIHGKDIDARSDVFSLGVVLYEMLAGTKPFVGDNVVAISHAILNHSPPQPAGLPYELWSVVERAIEKAPSQRFSSAVEMQRALERAVQHTRDGDVVQPAGVPPTPQTTIYGQPYGQAPPPPPGQPYGHPYGQPYGQPPGQPYGQGPPQTPPILYPHSYYRLPRAPLMTPQAKLLLLRVLTATVLIASLLALAAALVVAIVNLVSDGQAAGRPSAPASQPMADLPRYVKEAALEPDPAARQRRWSEAAAGWAARIQSSPDADAALAEAIEAYLAAAEEAARAGRAQGAREAVTEARSFARESAVWTQAVDRAAAELGIV